MDEPPAERTVLRARVYAFIHHLLLAATISCAMLLFESSAAYRALDNFTHYVMGSSKFLARWGDAASKREGATASMPLSEYPRVLIIPEELQGPNIGPPSKSILAGIIDRVLEMKPRLIVLAMDVGPFGPDFENNDPEILRHHTQLTQTLDAAARRGVGVVVLAPLVGADQLGQARFDWLRARCEAGIHFGLAVPRPPDVPIYDYSRSSSSVALIASQLENHNTHHDDHIDVCALAREVGRSTDDFNRLIDRRRPHTHDFTTAVPLNTAFFGRNDNLHFISAAAPTFLHPEPTIEIGGSLDQNAAVFIGEDAPYIRTFGGASVSPVVMFAAEFFSETHPVEHSLSRGFLLHLGLGVLLGYLFGAIWVKHAGVVSHFKKLPWTPFPPKLRAYVWSRVSLIIALASLPLILKGFFSLSGWMLDREIWLNPIPLAIGMFIDALLHSRQDVTHHAARTMREHINEHPDMALQALFVGGVILYVFVGGQPH